MPSSTPPPGRPGAPPRRGIGGLLGLLAVLAFVILAAVILIRREPGTIAEVPPASPVVPPTTTPVPPPSEAPPSTEPAASAEPVAPVAESPLPPPGKPSRPARRAGAAPATGGPRVASADPATSRRGPGALPPMGSSPRRFLLGTTSIESLKPVERDLKGFETGGVGVKRAPEVNGRVELVMDPPQVRPGVDYTVKVYLANDGSKDIPVQEVTVSTAENGKSASRTLTPLARSVKPQQRALLHEVSGVWREAARSWSMDVVVTSGRQDVYRNRLRWE
jgi:hypothetical protein